MCATRNTTDRLATIRQFREAATVRSAPITARLEERSRIDRFLALWSTASRKPTWYYDFTRGEERRRHPSEVERSLIHQGIADGTITREQVIAYRAAQLHDDLAAFGTEVPADDALYVQVITEGAEAMDAATRAKGMPSRAHAENAIRELQELIAVAQLHVVNLSRGCAS